jgi:hypothetical protein
MSRRPSHGVSVGIALLALSGACSKSDLIIVTDEQTDLPRPADLLIPPSSDLGMESKDLAMPSDLASQYSCRGEDAPGTSYKLVMNKLTLPSSSGSGAFLYDYDGDGRAENQLKNLISTVSLAGLDIQTTLQNAVTSGQLINLVALKSSSTDSSSCVGVSLNQGKPGPTPRFDGTDTFMPAMAMGSPLGGTLSSGRLVTTDSRSLKADTEAQFSLQISLGSGLVTLPLRGVHVEGTLQSSGSLRTMSSGVLHGVVAKSDIERKLMPALADQITQMINSDPYSSTSQTIIGLFESKTAPVSVNKCMTMSRCCRLSPATCVILPEEVSASPIGGVIAPDVEVLDAAGKWKPVPGGKNYNAMSVGMGFTAISAWF